MATESRSYYPITVIIPCYNEAQRLPVGAFRDYMRAHPSIKFLFVNDGSTDNTQVVLNNLTSEFPQSAATLELSQNGGKGEAVRQGILKAAETTTEGFVGFLDADLSAPLSEITRVLDMGLNNNPQSEFIFASRIGLLGWQVQRKMARHYLGRVFATAVSVMFGVGAYDTQCGVKFVTKTLAKDIFARPFHSKWFFDIELFIRAKVYYGTTPLAARLAEIPVWQWCDVAGSRLKSSDFLKAPWELLRLKWHYHLASRN